MRHDQSVRAQSCFCTLTANRVSPACVKLPNSLIANSGRRTDFIHIPVLAKRPAEYSAPLKDLKLRDAKLYLGVIHDMDDENEFKRLLATLKKSVPAFGIAAQCGLARYGVAGAANVIEDHRKALALYRRGQL